MIQIQWWWSSDVPNWIWFSDDDLDRVMIQIQWWWSISSDDPDTKMKMTWRWRWLEDEYDMKMQMTRWSKEEDQWWKLFRENTFLFKRECWCNCNFRMYSLIFLMYYNLMFIPGCTCVMSHLDVPIGRIYNVNKSCQVIVGNYPIV